MCKFSQFNLVCPDVRNVTFFLTSVCSIKLPNVTSSRHITVTRCHVPQIITSGSHLTSNINGINEFI